MAPDGVGPDEVGPDEVGPDEVGVILFDVGGVLVELLGVPVMMAWTCGRFTEETLWRAWVDSPAVTAFETGRTGPAEFSERMVAEFDLPVTPRAFLEEFGRWPGRLFPGVPDLLDRLAARYPLATLSNTNAVHWPIVTRGMGLSARIGRHFPSHLTGLVKPDRRAFEGAVEGLDVAPGRILYLDDSVENVRAARDVGMNAHRAAGTEGVLQALAEAGISRG